MFSFLKTLAFCLLLAPSLWAADPGHVNIDLAGRVVVTGGRVAIGPQVPPVDYGIYFPDNVRDYDGSANVQSSITSSVPVSAFSTAGKWTLSIWCLFAEHPGSWSGGLMIPDEWANPGLIVHGEINEGPRKIRLQYGSQLLLSTTEISLFTWYHVVATHDGAGVVNLWVNGVNEIDDYDTLEVCKERDSDRFIIGGGHRNHVGDEQGSYYNPKAMFNQAAAWTNVLTDSEIAGLYNSGAGRAISPTEPALAALWNFEENVTESVAGYPTVLVIYQEGDVSEYRTMDNPPEPPQ